MEDKIYEYLKENTQYTSVYTGGGPDLTKISFKDFSELDEYDEEYRFRFLKAVAKEIAELINE